MNKKIQSNILGDLRAESDSIMLESAFYESPDYRTLLESRRNPIVVGRRGTGKSAILYRLKRHFSEQDKTKVIKISPEEDQVIGIRSLLKLFGDKFNHIKRGALITWKYAMYMRVIEEMAPHYKLKKLDQYPYLEEHLERWSKYGGDFTTRYRQHLKECLNRYTSPEDRISSMASDLDLSRLEKELDSALLELKVNVVILIDKMDEGYEPDDIGIAFVDGVAQAVIELNDYHESFYSVIFLRDNIFRSVALKDPDYSRNIEGQVLRLHWDEYHLFALVCARLNVAFQLDEEKSLKIWNKVTSKNLSGKDGFRKCLQFTLYRPRDILSLLNKAFYNAARHDRDVLVDEDVETTAREISEGRLDDLRKEYTAIFPSLPEIIKRFSGGAPEFTVGDAEQKLDNIRDIPSEDNIIQQDLEILKSPIDIIKNLYSVGFIGLLDKSQGNYLFCHDGAAPSKEFQNETNLLIHPCYWMALNLTRNALDPDEAEVIYDEYDIRVSSVTPEQREKRLGQLMSALDDIAPGPDDAHDFESWCFDAVTIVFAGALSNFEIHPNKDAKQRRDIVATNLGATAAWRRILEDYGTRQVIFEVKNFSNIGASEYRQMLSYGTDKYGRVGFIITRDDDENLRKGGDLEWMKEMYLKHDHLIIKLTAKWLSKLLSKLRNPQKHDVVDKTLNGLLDRYHRQYL